MLDTAIILNAPPNTGKDTLAAMTEQVSDFVQAEFKEALYRETIDCYQVDHDEFMSRHLDRELKEEPWDMLNGLSTRDALKHVSEKIIKPTKGKYFFGLEAVSRCIEQSLKYGTKNFIFSDGGFIEEIEVLEQVFDLVIVIQLHRHGCEWGEDTRSYVELEDESKVFMLHLTEGEPEKAVGAIFHLLNLARDAQRMKGAGKAA